MLTPYRGYLLLEPIADQEQKTEGGFVLPDAAKEKQAQGKVVKLGHEPYIFPDKTLEWELKIGDIVYYKRFGGEEVENKKYVIVHYSNILGYK